MATYRYHEVGVLSWYGDIWMLCLLRLADRVLRIYVLRLAREVTLIIGARLIQRSAGGNPPIFSGGLHFAMSFQWPLVGLSRSVRRDPAFSTGTRPGAVAITGRWAGR